MLKQITDFFIIALNAIAVLTHVLKLIYIFFEPKILGKIKFISNRDISKSQLILYYLLTILVCIYVIDIKLSR